MSSGSDPSDRTGPCAGYKCACKVYVQVKADRMWPVCQCRHVLQTHARPEINPETLDYHLQTSQSPSTDELLDRLKKGVANDSES